MPFTSIAYRVLIASPSDLAEERRAVMEAIATWNALHAGDESVVLLPAMWETHATPEAGVRPQEVLNRQIVQDCDILVGMFWTKLGTKTPIAESGTVEEIDQFVAAGKPASIYFSSRPIDPNKIDLKQLRRLRVFKDATYKSALVGDFRDVADLRVKISADLLRHVRRLKPMRIPRGTSKLDKAAKVTELIRVHKEHNITPEEYLKYGTLFGLRRRTDAISIDPVQVGEIGPNGYKVGYTAEGDKVEWVPDDEHPGHEIPLRLRRNDNAILAAYNEFHDKVWWNRHQAWADGVKAGRIGLHEEQKVLFEKAARIARSMVRRYGLQNLECDDFNWGLMSGKLSALAWVLGAEWEESLDS